MNASAVVRLAALAALATACAPQRAAPPRPDEKAIRAALDSALATVPPALAAKDTAALANIFTADATWILPDASSFTGRADIEAGADKFFKTFDSATIDLPTIDKLIVVSDSEAVTFAHATYTMTVKGKAPEKGLNPFAQYWKKGANDVWRVAYEVNASGPVPSAAPTKR